MNQYTVLTQNQLNSLIYVMLHNFNLNIPLNFNDTVNDYCSLGLDLNGNQEAGNEYIINNSIIVNLSNVKYKGNSYYLRLFYYDLKDGDLDNTKPYEVIKEKTIKITTGDNTISFDEELVYLQKNFELIIGG